MIYLFIAMLMMKLVRN